MISITAPALTTLFLVVIRVGAALLFLPIQGVRQLPTHAKLILVFTLSALLISNLSLKGTTADETTLLISALAELGNGLILSMSLYAAFAIFQIAGQLIDTQMGLNSLAIFNPGEHSHEPLASYLLTLLAGLFFFSIGGHRWLIQGLAFSFLNIPPGKLVLFNNFALIISQFSLMFSLALMIASPVIIGLLLIDLCSAVLTRNMPQVSSYFLVLPIKILFGFFLLGLMLTYINPIMEHIFKGYFHAWQGIIG